MFYDPRFNPANYLDQLFYKLVGDTSNPQVYKRLAGDPSNPTLATVNNLITEMDFMIQEMVDLDDLPKLQSSGELLNDKTTRLQYYAQVVNTAIVALEQELVEVATEVAPKGEQSETVLQLAKLSQAKKNLQAVLDVCELAYRVVGQKTVTSVELQEVFRENPESKECFEGLLEGMNRFNN